MPGLAPTSIIVQVVLWHKHLFFFCSSFQPILQQCLECHPCFHIQVPLGHFREHFNRRYKLLLLKALFFCWERSYIQSRVSGDFVAHDLTSRSAAQGWKRSPRRSVSILCTKQPTLKQKFSLGTTDRSLEKDVVVHLGGQLKLEEKHTVKCIIWLKYLWLIIDRWVPNHFINLTVWDCKR